MSAASPVEALSPPSTNPFVGAKPFEEENAAVFFGRDAEIDSLMTELGAPLLHVLHAESAAGKSSLIMAGLVPRLRIQRLSHLVAVDQGFASGLHTAAVPLVVRNWTAAGPDEGKDGYYAAVVKDVECWLQKAAQQNLKWLKHLDDTTETVRGHLPGFAESSNSPLKNSVERVANEELANVQGLLELVAKRSGAGSDDANAPQASRYVSLVKSLTDALGEVVIVLDQFEEILRREDKGGSSDPVLVGVQDAQHRCGHSARQLISMRSDYTRLLEKAWAGSDLWSPKTTTELQPLDFAKMFHVVYSTAKPEPYNIEIEDAFLGKVLGWFSEARRFGVPLENRPIQQLPMNALLERMCALGEDRGITRKAFERLQYPSPETDSGLSEREIDEQPDRLRNAVLRDWLVRELRPRTSPRQWEAWQEALCSCLFARIAPKLSSAAETKRPVPVEEVHRLALGPELADPESPPEPSGQARLRAVNLQREGRLSGKDPDPAAIQREVAQWTRRQLVGKDGCLDEVRKRLQDSNILKTTGGAETWELAHDGFAVPALEWAQQYLTDPEYFVRWLVATQATLVRLEGTKWHEKLDLDTQGRRVLGGVVWKRCAIKDADFTGVDMHDCDFGLSMFEHCTFADHAIKDCVISIAWVREDCSFSRVVVSRGEMANTVFGNRAAAGRLEMRDVTFRHVDIDMCLIERGRLEDVKLIEVSIPRLPTERARYKDIGRKALDFFDCTVAGAIGLRFERCELGASSLEIMRIEGTGAALQFENTGLRAGFLNDILRAEGSGEGPCVRATHCDFSGTVLRQCDLSDARFAGVELQRAVIRSCDLGRAHFGPATSGTEADTYCVPAEHLVIRGCHCDETTLEQLELDRSIITKCRGELLRLKDCSLVGAGLYDLRGSDNDRFSDQCRAGLRAAAHLTQEENGFHINAESCNVYHWDWDWVDPEMSERVTPDFDFGKDLANKKTWVARAGQSCVDGRDLRWKEGGWTSVPLGPREESPS